MNIILYASQQDQNFQWVILAIAMLLIIGLIIMLLWQQRTGRELTTELAQLEKEKHRSVEFDFVLKAMGLSIWHINTDSGEIFFDKDFREKSEDQSIGIEGGSINDNSLLLVEEDATRINKALSDLCAGVTEEYHEQYRVKVAHSAKTYWEESYHCRPRHLRSSFSHCGYHTTYRCQQGHGDCTQTGASKSRGKRSSKVCFYRQHES